MNPSIAVIDLSKNYGKCVAVNKLSFKVEPGVVYGLIGPNGAGKTTTLSILAGLVSFLSPCVLPLVPAYVGYLSGQAVRSAS